MADPVLDIRLLGPADWRVLRDTRVRALIDSPEAFRPYGEHEWSEHQWRLHLAAAAWLVAIERGIVIGVAGLAGTLHEELRHVESIWVAPDHRRPGVFRSLLNSVIETARRASATQLRLWVLEDNVCAQLAYERLGFVWTGERQPIGSGRRRFERRLCLAI